MSVESTKTCPTCGCATMIELRSDNEKMCSKCHTKVDWPLEEGQEALLGSSRHGKRGKQL